MARGALEKGRSDVATLVLPVLSGSATVDDALEAMKANACTAVAFAAGDEIRILNYASIATARDANRGSLGEIEFYEVANPLERHGAAKPDFFARFVPEENAGFTLLRAAASSVTVLTSDDRAAALASYARYKCNGTQGPHYYPCPPKNSGDLCDDCVGYVGADGGKARVFLDP
jgi:hypothetical protein